MADKNGKLYHTGWSGVDASLVGSFIGRTLTAGETTILSTIVPALETTILTSIGRNLLDTSTDSYYEIRDAGASRYRLFNYPIKEVTKITLDGVTVYQKGVTSTWVLNTDFWVDEQTIDFDVSTESGVDNRNALVIYYTIEAIGQDAKLALLQWASELILNREFAGKKLSNLSNNGVSMAFDTSTIPDYVQKVVDNYLKVLI